MKWSKYVKPYLKYFILGPVCMVVEVAGEILMPLFLKIVINGGTADANGVTTLTVSQCLLVTALMAITAIVMMAGGVGGAYFGGKASVNFAADLREDLFKKIQNFSFTNIDKFSSSSLITRLTNDITQIQNLVNMMLRMMLRAPGMLIGALIMAIYISPPLSVVLAVAIPTLAVTVGLVIVVGFGRFTVLQKKIDGINNTVKESITNSRVVKSFVREDFEEQKFRAANGDLKASGMAAMKVVIFIEPIMTIIMSVTTLAVVWFGGNIVLDGGMIIGDLSAFLTYVAQILMSLLIVTFMLMMSSRALASAKRVKEVLKEDITLDDLNAQCKDAIVTHGSISFRNVTYRYYRGSEEAVLSDINLDIAAGSTVGIVGSTGCGKSTLVSLIPRLYDCDEGEVLVDGINVKDYSLYNLREGVGMVLQKNVLFAGTIEDNLRWGNQNATEEELRAAAESAQADKFVTSFKNGYQTELGQGGVNVSGGQKQRLCIARALLKKPKILILDDSTSAVDTATEQMIRTAFATDLVGATKIIIAQRISSVSDADVIVVMNEGRITGIGKHVDLLANNIEYQEIYYSQNEKPASINGKEAR